MINEREVLSIIDQMRISIPEGNQGSAPGLARTGADSAVSPDGGGPDRRQGQGASGGDDP